MVDIIPNGLEEANEKYKCVAVAMHISNLYSISLCNDELRKYGFLIVVSYLNYKPIIIKSYKISVPNLSDIVIHDDYVFVLTDR